MLISASFASSLVSSGSGTEFDPEVVAAFRKVVAPYPVGSEITLADGRRGIVASVSQDAPERPVVRVTHDAQGGLVDPVEIPLAGPADVDAQAA